MISEELKNRVKEFTESVINYYGKKIIISESITTDKLNFDRHFTTFNRFELVFENMTWRISGVRLILNNQNHYYEIAADHLIAFNQTTEHKFEFIEQYNDVVYRRTILDFSI